MRLAGEATCRGDIDERASRRGQQRHRMLDAHLHVVLIRRNTGSDLEHAEEMGSAVTTQFCQIAEPDPLM